MYILLCHIILLYRLREFGFKLSVIAAPLREATLAVKRGNAIGAAQQYFRRNATFFEVYSVTPHRARI